MHILLDNRHQGQLPFVRVQGKLEFPDFSAIDSRESSWWPFLGSRVINWTRALELDYIQYHPQWSPCYTRKRRYCFQRVEPRKLHLPSTYSGCVCTKCEDDNHSRFQKIPLRKKNFKLLFVSLQKRKEKNCLFLPNYRRNCSWMWSDCKRTLHSYRSWVHCIPCDLQHIVEYHLRDNHRCRRIYSHPR